MGVLPRLHHTWLMCSTRQQLVSAPSRRHSSTYKALLRKKGGATGCAPRRTLPHWIRTRPGCAQVRAPTTGPCRAAQSRRIAADGKHDTPPCHVPGIGTGVAKGRPRVVLQSTMCSHQRQCGTPPINSRLGLKHFVRRQHMTRANRKDESGRVQTLLSSTASAVWLLFRRLDAICRQLSCGLVFLCIFL